MKRYMPKHNITKHKHDKHKQTKGGDSILEVIIIPTLFENVGIQPILYSFLSQVQKMFSKFST